MNRYPFVALISLLALPSLGGQPQAPELKEIGKVGGLHMAAFVSANTKFQGMSYPKEVKDLRNFNVEFYELKGEIMILYAVNREEMKKRVAADKVWPGGLEFFVDPKTLKVLRVAAEP